MLASLSRPGVFAPVALEGDHYVDGGLAEPLGVRLADARNADLIVVVDVTRRPRADAPAFDPECDDPVQRALQLVGGATQAHELHRHAASRHLVLVQPEVVGLADRGAARNEAIRRGERAARRALAEHGLTRYLCAPDEVRVADRDNPSPGGGDYVELDVDPDLCIHCGLCAVTCETEGYAAVPWGSVVRKLHHYECTRDGACERVCPTAAIRLRPH